MNRKYKLPKPRAEARQARCMAETRQEDKFQGTPCKYGHSGIRYTKTGLCIECAGVSRVAYHKKLRQRIADLEAENATLRHQHGNDEAAGRMLVDAIDRVKSSYKVFGYIDPAELQYESTTRIYVTDREGEDGCNVPVFVMGNYKIEPPPTKQQEQTR